MKPSEIEVEVIKDLLHDGTMAIYPLMFKKDKYGGYEVIVDMKLMIDGEPEWSGFGKLTAPWINRLMWNFSDDEDEEGQDGNLPLGTGWGDLL